MTLWEQLLDRKYFFMPFVFVMVFGITLSFVFTLQSSCLDTSAPSFPRSAQERMLSFNERKARLIENARQRYIEKHGLKNVGLNC